MMKIEGEVFLIPYKRNFILYAPLKGIISLINPAAAQQLRMQVEGKRLESDTYSLLIDDHFPFNNDPVKNLTIILTSDCTMNCIYCYAKGGEKREVLKWEIFTGVLNEVFGSITRSGYKDELNVTFHGGDSSSVWNLFKRSVAHIREKSLASRIPVRISVGTNGVLSSTQQRWLVSNIDDATVSIDGFDTIQNLQRPLKGRKNSFQIVNQTLKFFDRAGFHYGIRSTVTNYSVGLLPEIIDFFCRNYIVGKIMVEPLFPMGRGNSTEVPSTAAFITNFRKADRVAKQSGVSLKFSGARLDTTTTIFCQALDNSLVITPDGLVSSCYEVINSDDPVNEYFFFGHYDLLKRKFIFNREKRERLFSAVRQEKRKCNDCFCKYHCAGDCPVKIIHSRISGQQVSFDRCQVIRELTKDQLIAALGIARPAYKGKFLSNSI